jgi:hypothetical protein
VARSLRTDTATILGESDTTASDSIVTADQLSYLCRWMGWDHAEVSIDSRDRLLWDPKSRILAVRYPPVTRQAVASRERSRSQRSIG